MKLQLLNKYASLEAFLSKYSVADIMIDFEFASLL